MTETQSINVSFDIKSKIIKKLLDVERYDLLEEVNEMSPNEIVLLYMASAPVEEYVIEAISNKLIEIDVPF